VSAYLTKTLNARPDVDAVFIRRFLELSYLSHCPIDGYFTYVESVMMEHFLRQSRIYITLVPMLLSRLHKIPENKGGRLMLTLGF